MTDIAVSVVPRERVPSPQLSTPPFETGDEETQSALLETAKGVDITWEELTLAGVEDVDVTCTTTLRSGFNSVEISTQPIIITSSLVRAIHPNLSRNSSTTHHDCKNRIELVGLTKKQDTRSIPSG
ncbi:hypothetical protein PIB30_011281 [Stylosanthes scabra]|uniref:Uncharacterized protein n=1 Tax=Stylosanthes scabra TaxID=79078 RepID=A0ABU6V4P4_9FABA|nr:hypothetical protein [Stylosanthes scabra]